MGNQVLREDQLRDPTQQTPEENITGCSKRRMDRPSIALDRVGPNFNQDLEYELDDELEEKFCKKRQGCFLCGLTTEFSDWPEVGAPQRLLGRHRIGWRMIVFQFFGSARRMSLR